MRILIVSDIHANWPALAAIKEPFDLALFLGDLVDYGLEPAPCIDWVRRNCEYSIRGNHDHGAAHGVAVLPTRDTSYKYLTAQTRFVGRDRFAPGDREYLAQLPVTQWITIEGIRILLVHGTPRDPLDEFAPAEEAFWAKRLEGIDADIVCAGHTHQQYAIEVGATLVLNPGSVGLQREGDPRAAYAILDGTKVHLRRIDYPIEETVKVVEAAPLPDDVKGLLTNVYRNGRLMNGGTKEIGLLAE